MNTHTIQYVKGKDNPVADSLSGIHVIQNKIPNLMSRIEDLIKNCDVCQKEKLVRIRPKEEPVISDTPLTRSTSSVIRLSFLRSHIRPPVRRM